MGANIQKKDSTQILLIGPEQSGKTTLLYKQKLTNTQELGELNETIGFQYEEIDNGDSATTCGIWDVGGGEASQSILSAVIQNVKFSVVLYVIDIRHEINGMTGGIIMSEKPQTGFKTLSQHSKMDLARKQLHRIMAEDELREVHTLVIVLNCNINKYPWVLKSNDKISDEGGVDEV